MVMGFGSYDESDQREQGMGTDEDDGESVDVHQHEHEGEVRYETDASTDDLLDRLQDMKTDDEE